MRRLLLLLPFAAAACAPMINDITTTPDDPPAFRARPPYPPGNAAVQKEAYPGLAPIALAGEPARAYAAALAAAKRMPRWSVVYEDASARVLEAVATTGLMRYKDDVVIAVRPAPGGSAVHVRSKSRLGKGDFGANAKRIQAFAAELKKGS
jgi:uncharacterized protein (DUF1499 family)